MNYWKHYHFLIERARTRSAPTPCEKHHVLPRCMGGSNAKSNIVALTPEEHFVAHQLLVKMHPKNVPLVTALQYLCSSNGRDSRNNKMYGWIRRQAGEAQKQRWEEKGDEMRAIISSDANRKKISDGLRKKWQDPEYRAKLQEIRSTEEHKKKRGAAISAAINEPSSKAKWAANHQDPLRRQKHSDEMKRQWQDPEVRARRSAAMKAAWERRRETLNR